MPPVRLARGRMPVRSMQRQTVGGRIVPSRGPEQYKTYKIAAPLRTHWRLASCEEYGCEDFLNGFTITINLETELGQKQYYYLTHNPERKAGGRQERLNTALVSFHFGPGNRCVRSGEHRVPMGRPPLLLVAQGDWRGNPRNIPVRRHRNHDDWVNDFGDHQNRIKKVIEGA